MPRQVNLGQIVPNIQIGETTTSSPGTQANVTNVGTTLNPILNFSIPKGEPGAIKMQIVNELPLIGSEDTIYLVPNEGETGNNYDEYIYVNNTWEKLGGIQVHVDLTDYVKNTDYASTSKGGTVKTNSNYGTDVDENGYLRGTEKTYSDYGNRSSLMLISKGTLENVITGKGLTTKSYVDGLVGDINDALDLLNGEVI